MPLAAPEPTTGLSANCQVVSTYILIYKSSYFYPCYSQNHDGFITYLKTLNKNKDTAKSIARGVALYLNEAEENKTDTARLLSICELKQFLTIMKNKIFKPSTQRNKLIRMKL